MKMFALSMTNAFSLYLLIFTLEFMRIAAIKTLIFSSYCSHKGIMKSKKAFNFNSNCYFFVSISDILDSCQKFSKRSGLLEGIQNIRTNRQR